jgi:Amino acid transporters
MSDMVSHDASAVHDDTKTSVNAISAESDNAFQDTKEADAEQNHADTSTSGELKRKLKSRHLQMIAIGMSWLSESKWVTGDANLLL